MTVPSVSEKLRNVKNRSSTAPISAAGRRGRSFIVFLRLLTLSELCFTVREVFFSFGPHTHHEPVGRRVATIDLHSARVRPQGCTRDHRRGQWGGRRIASSSRRVSAADRRANSL